MLSIRGRSLLRVLFFFTTMQSFQTFIFLLTVSQLAFSASPSINEPANGAIINPGANFKFSYQSIADYETSSHNYSVWLFTSLPQGFFPSMNYAAGYYFGRYCEPNYPGTCIWLFPSLSLSTELIIHRQSKST